MKIVVINGYAGVGKSSFVKFCRDFGLVMEYSVIDPVKDLAKEIGWNGEKTEKDRLFLSDLKDVLTEYNDYPFQKTVERIKQDVFTKFSLADLNGLVIFIHCREPQEVDRFKWMFNSKGLIIRREKAEQIKQINHADNDVFSGEYEYTIENNSGLEDLRYMAESFMETLYEDKNWESHF